MLILTELGHSKCLLFGVFLISFYKRDLNLFMPCILFNCLAFSLNTCFVQKPKSITKWEFDKSWVILRKVYFSLHVRHWSHSLRWWSGSGSTVPSEDILLICFHPLALVLVPSIVTDRLSLSQNRWYYYTIRSRLRLNSKQPEFHSFVFH